MPNFALGASTVTAGGTKRPAIGVGVAAIDATGRLIMIRRGKPPGRGGWSLPGGHVEFGETLEIAAVREMREETGLTVSLGPMLGTVDIIDDSSHFVLIDYLAWVTEGVPRAGDDALEVAQFCFEDAIEKAVFEDTKEMIRKAQALYQQGALRPLQEAMQV